MPNYADVITEALILPSLRFGFIGDAAAGDHTLTGIRPEDKLVAVVGCTLTLSEGAPNTIAWTFSDLTSEFSITADDTVNNTGGTALTDMFCIVVYLDIPETIDP